MKKQRILILSFCFAMFIFLMLSGVALAGGITIIELNKTSNYSRIDFDDAYTMVWSGDVNYGGATIGEYTATLKKDTNTGSNGVITQYDLIIPGSSVSIADFVSIRTNHIATGAGADLGMIYATSPGFKHLVGATVRMNGSTTKITW